MSFPLFLCNARELLGDKPLRSVTLNVYISASDSTTKDRHTHNGAQTIRQDCHIVLPCCVTYPFRCLHSFVERNRSALPTTETELKLMAAVAIIGLSNIPHNGNRTPAAIGTPMALYTKAKNKF